VICDKALTTPPLQRRYAILCPIRSNPEVEHRFAGQAHFRPERKGAILI
jgi:hypothetical protein